MLGVQAYLQEKTNKGLGTKAAVAVLGGEFGIRATYSELEPLVILNYSQIDSPKHHPIVRECRGLTLELDSWEVVARSFQRFFNAGECPEEEKKFDWSNFTATSKEDGSLMLLYKYKDRWRVNTRGSFGLGEISPAVGKTWEEMFYSAIDEVGMDSLPTDNLTYVFEFCSPYNKIVRRYIQPTLFLLTAFHNPTGVEINDVLLDRLANLLRVERPDGYDFTTLQQIKDWLDEETDPTYEGLVCRDKSGLRIKVKSRRYVALHHLKDNGNIFLPKNLLPLVLKGEQGEVLTHFAEATAHYLDVVEKLQGQWGRLSAIWEVAKGIEKQKDFAMFVTKHTRLASILFEARKRKVEPKEVWRESEAVLLKTLFS